MSTTAPVTVEEAIAQLHAKICDEESDETVSRLMTMSEDDFLGDTHHFAGRNIRNEWGLWFDNKLTRDFYSRYGLTHADDMSTVLFRCVHRRMNGRPMYIPSIVKSLKNYWERKGGMPPPVWEKPKAPVPEKEPAVSADAIQLSIELARALSRFDGIKRLFDRTPTMKRVTMGYERSGDHIRTLVDNIDLAADLMSKIMADEFDALNNEGG